MKTLRCIVLEDEEPAQNLIKNYLSRIQSIELLQVFDNAIEASNFLAHQVVDLIITDISMPHLSGLDFIRMLSPSPHIIIMTAHADYALESYDLDVIDYLKKPISFDRFQKSIEKVQRLYSFTDSEDKHASSETMVYVKEGSKMIKVNFNDIIYVEGLRDYIKIITDADRPIVTHITMKKMVEILPPQSFMRVHKSYIIATDKITSIDSSNSLIELKNNIMIPMGQNYKETLMSKIKPIN